jgi:hypothetical protein
VVHDPGCSIPGIVCAEHCPRATAHGPRGALEEARVMRIWGLHWDWLERDPRSLVGRYACSPPHGPRTTALGPLLQRRETRLTDRFPITRLMLLQ